MLVPLLLSLALLAASVSAAPATCDQRGYCPASCARAGATEADGLALLDGHLELLANIGRAVDVMRSFPGVATDDRLDIHTTFQYICCVTVEELVTKVFPALDSVRWAPVNISYSRAVCNKDGSIILMADDASQAALGAVVARFEAAIEAAGVAVVPRATMEGFHMTIGTTNSSYPMEEALAAINAAVPEGTWTAPFALTNFAFLRAWPTRARARRSPLLRCDPQPRALTLYLTRHTAHSTREPSLHGTRALAVPIPHEVRATVA
jgi:hypothetical protein